MNEKIEEPKKDPLLQRTSVWVLLVPSLISFIIATLVLILFLRG